MDCETNTKQNSERGLTRDMQNMDNNESYPPTLDHYILFRGLNLELSFSKTDCQPSRGFI